MKKILFITAFNPSKADAGSNYTRQLLGEIGKEHEVDLVVFRYADQQLYAPESEHVRIADSFVISTATKVVGLLSQPWLFPLFTARFSYPILQRLRALVAANAYDVVYFDFSQTFAYAPLINHPCKLLMAHDVIYQRYERRNKLLGWWTRISEHRLLKAGTKIFTFSDKDCSLIRNHYNMESSSTSFFIQQEAIDAMPNPKEDYYVFYGNWNRPDNYESLGWFLDNVYDKIDRSVQFKVIGLRMPEAYKERIAALSNMEYLGFVDNPYQIIADAKALISPLHNGAGVKVKVIEALACGTPVIGTDIAFEGIDEKYSQLMVVANTPHDYKQQIEQLAITLDARRDYKAMFIKNYTDKPVLRYLSNA